MKTKEKQTVLFFCVISLKDVFIEKFIERGYNIIDFHNDEFVIPKPNLFDKLKNIFYRLFLKRKDYYERRRKVKFIEESLRRINEIDLKKVDYAVFFRADLYPEALIKIINKEGRVRMSSYQSDGISGKMLKILDYRKYFDDVFCFNPEDIIKYKESKLKFLTNCYFNNENEVVMNSNGGGKDIVLLRYC